MNPELVLGKDDSGRGSCTVATSVGEESVAATKNPWGSSDRPSGVLAGPTGGLGEVLAEALDARAVENAVGGENI